MDERADLMSIINGGKDTIITLNDSSETTGIIDGMMRVFLKSFDIIREGTDNDSN